MTVPPPVVAANRTQLATLVATNVLGRTPRRSRPTKPNYAGMWAQDAGAMYGYAGQSAAATQLTPFTAPAQTTNAGGTAAQSAAVTAAAGTRGALDAVTADHHVPTALQGWHPRDRPSRRPRDPRDCQAFSAV